MASDPKQAPVPVAELEYEHSPLEDAVIRYRKQLILVGTLALLGFGLAGLAASRRRKQ